MSGYNLASFKNVGPLSTVDTKKLYFKPLPVGSSSDVGDFIFGSIFYYSEPESRPRYNVPLKVVLPAATLLYVRYDERFERWQLSFSLTDEEIQKLGALAGELQATLLKEGRKQFPGHEVEVEQVPSVDDVKIFNRSLTVKAPQLMKSCHVVFTKGDGSETSLAAGLPAENYFQGKLDANGVVITHPLIPAGTVADVVLQMGYLYKKTTGTYSFGVWPTGIKALTGHNVPL